MVFCTYRSVLVAMGMVLKDGVREEMMWAWIGRGKAQ